jgi:voltage-gated potassium channel
MPVKRRVFDILDVRPDDRGLERAVNVSLLALIVANVAAVILETVDPNQARFGQAFDVFEAFSVVVFGAEDVPALRARDRLMAV